ncbi:hypothetical protein [Nitrospirillum pindoramense]|uniref:hypothetical protein n=1 Tax=Nitrospirillum amazonense TaxID=28077 RepID=UPI0011A74877|nr:hypothetical protein [Nitrospirillum amazonense]
MIPNNDQSIGKKPTSWYIFNFAVAALGLPILVNSFMGNLNIHPNDDAVTFFAFMLMIILLYSPRLIFWEKVPARFQEVVRNAIISIFIMEIIATIAVLSLFFANLQVSAGGGERFVAVYDTSLAALCQISTIIWLLRYRKE